MKISRQEVHQKYYGHCAYCGKEITIKEMQIDHKIAQRNGGTDDIENLMPSCRRCNHYKRANSLDTFRQLVYEIPQKLSKEYLVKVGLDYELIEFNTKNIKFYFEKIESEKD